MRLKVFVTACIGLATAMLLAWPWASSTMRPHASLFLFATPLAEVPA